MEIPDELVCLFSTHVEWRDGAYALVMPTSEISNGAIDPDTTYRVAVLSHPAETPRRESSLGEREPFTRSGTLQSDSPPPVSVGDTLTVCVTDIGEQGDGIARVDGEFVIFVPGTDVGDEVTIEVTHLVDTYGFGRTVDQSDVE